MILSFLCFIDISYFIVSYKIRVFLIKRFIFSIVGILEAVKKYSLFIKGPLDKKVLVYNIL